MLTLKYAIQPARRVTYLSLFQGAFENGEFTRLDAAVAYATLGGVIALESELIRLAPTAWPLMTKRWLVSVDWCRTEPLALGRLSALPRSRVKVHDGRVVVRRRGCVPRVSFHPKAFILRGANQAAIISGSANLSRNGLGAGYEVGNLILCELPLAANERSLWASCLEVMRWFNGAWREATEWTDIQRAYQVHYDSSIQMRSPVPTEDDSAQTNSMVGAASGRRRAITPEQLTHLRACRHLWIEAGNLHENRGPGKPGNQLMLSPMTRVFFGFEARDLPRDTLIGHATLEYQGYSRPDCSLRFSNNAMDVLTLLVPDREGPPGYDGKTLMFERLLGSTFRLTMGDSASVRNWKELSDSIEARYEMSSGRQWGVF